MHEWDLIKKCMGFAWCMEFGGQARRKSCNKAVAHLLEEVRCLKVDTHGCEHDGELVIWIAVGMSSIRLCMVLGRLP